LKQGEEKEEISFWRDTVRSRVGGREGRREGGKKGEDVFSQGRMRGREGVAENTKLAIFKFLTVCFY